MLMAIIHKSSPISKEYIALANVLTYTSFICVNKHRARDTRVVISEIWSVSLRAENSKSILDKKSSGVNVPSRHWRHWTEPLVNFNQLNEEKKQMYIDRFNWHNISL